MRTLRVQQKMRTRKFILEAVAATIYWIVVLTPFMILSNPSWLPVKIFIGMSREQYMSWLTVEIILIPILGVLSIWFIRKFEQYFKR